MDAEQIILTVDDFLTLPLDELISEINELECFNFAPIFGREAEVYWKSEEHNKGYALSLIAKCCAFGKILRSEELPIIDLPDFSEKDIVVLDLFVSSINDPELRARVADIICCKRRSYKLAQVAVDAYLLSSARLESVKEWYLSFERLKRAAHLANRWWKKEGQQLQEVMQTAEKMLQKYAKIDTQFMPIRLMEMLQYYQYYENANKHEKESKRLARIAEKSKNWDKAEQLWRISARWSKMQGNSDLEYKALCKSAETYVHRAKQYLTGDTPMYIMAAPQIGRAIESYRQIPNTGKRRLYLQRLLLQYQGESIHQFVPIRESTTIPEGEVNIIRSFVSNKLPEESIISLANICDIASKKKLKEQYEKKERSFLSEIFSNSIIGYNGLNVARQSEDPKQKIEQDLYSRAKMNFDIYFQAMIDPARLQILDEHEMVLADFEHIIHANSFIPIGHEYSVWRGLHSGMHGDFLISSHLLIPQLEASVRHILQQRMVITSGFNDNGIQDEDNLNDFLRDDSDKKVQYATELAKVIGADFVFSLRCLLIERFGYNLRNNMAHGLSPDGAFYHWPSGYLWWIALKFYCIPCIRFRKKVMRNMSVD
jgi:Domain of unknown function (DUF4209)